VKSLEVHLQTRNGRHPREGGAADITECSLGKWYTKNRSRDAVKAVMERYGKTGKTEKTIITKEERIDGLVRYLDMHSGVLPQVSRAGTIEERSLAFWYSCHKEDRDVKAIIRDHAENPIPMAGEKHYPYRGKNYKSVALSFEEFVVSKGRLPRRTRKSKTKENLAKWMTRQKRLLMLGELLASQIKVLMNLHPTFGCNNWALFLTPAVPLLNLMTTGFGTTAGKRKKSKNGKASP
jgi:hypothetical protein